MSPRKTKAKAVRKRNPISLNPLLRKSHMHGKSKKAERQQAKKDLKKEISDG